MNLFDVALKNIKGNFKNYLVYFVSLFFCVVIYYTFASLQYSTEVAKTIETSENMQSIFMVASVILIVFVAVFVMYSNSFFARKRKKEVGLYSLLGLPKQTIGKMLFYENVIIGALVLIAGIAAGSFLSKLFTMILLKLLGSAGNVGMVFSLRAVINTLIVFSIIILFTSIQGYRLIYRYRLIELFRAEQEGEREPRAYVASAVLAIVCLTVGYWFAFQSFSNNQDILRNIGLMTVGIILGTILLFSSLVILLLRTAKRNRSSYYKGMNLIGISHLVYRIKGNARTLSIISLLSALALCATNVGVGIYYGFEETARQTAPFTYMFVAQDAAYNETIDNIIRADEAHPVVANLTLDVVKSAGSSTSTEIVPERYSKVDPTPIKVISTSSYNQAAQALTLPLLDPPGVNETIAISTHVYRPQAGRLPGPDHHAADRRRPNDFFFRRYDRRTGHQLEFPGRHDHRQ